MDDTIISAIEKLSRVLRFLHQQIGKRYGLTALQVEIVSYLHRSSAQHSGVSQIAREFDLTKATVSDAVSTLERKHLLVKERIAQDRRRHRIAVTSRGRNLARMLPRWSRSIRNELQQFPEAQKERTAHLLMQLIKGLRETGLISVARMCLTCENLVHATEHGKDGQHFCRLLGRTLSGSELRMDCNGYRATQPRTGRRPRSRAPRPAKTAGHPRGRRT